MPDYNLNILVVGKDEGATQVLDKIVQGLGQVDSAGSKTAQSGGSIFSSLTITAGDAVHAVQAVVGEVEAIGHALIDGNAKFEQYNVAYTTLIKNSADFKAANNGVTDSLKLTALASTAAQQHMQDLADFGAKTPFDLPGVVEADTVLQGFGLNSSEAAKKFGYAGKEILTIAGDVASGTGANFKEMALTLGKFSSGATGEAIARMQELGITNREELTKMGLAFSDAGHLLSPLPQAMNVVLTLMKQKYGGLMDAQSATFNGMLSNLDDWKGQTLRTLGSPIFEALKPQLANLLALLGSDATKQAIHTFADGMAQAITSIPAGVQAVAHAIRDYGIPAVEGLAAATIAYAVSAVPAAVAALPALISEVAAATTAFAAQAVAVGAALGPFAAIGLVVAGLAYQYQQLQNRADDIAAKLAQNRQEYQYSSDVLTRYAGVQGYVQQATSKQADALKVLQAEQQTHIHNLAELNAKEELAGNNMRYGADLRRQHAEAVAKEKAEIDRLGIAIGQQSGALDNAIKGMDEQHLRSQDAIEDMRALRGAQGGFTQAVQLTDAELKDLNKDLEKVYKEGPQALGQAIGTTAQFLNQETQIQSDHAAKLAELHQQAAKAKTKAEKDGIKERIADEQAAFATQQQQAAIAYAQQEAAQKAHLGQELIDYVQAMAVKDSAFRDKADSLTSAIAKQYGVQQSLASSSFGQMLTDIDTWKTRGGQDVDQFTQHLSGMTDKAADLQHQIDEQTTKAVDALTKRFQDGKISVQEYTAALAKIPSEIVTNVQLNAAIATINGGDQGALGRHLVNDLPHRAGGGPVDALTPYVVGENGPELFFPKSAGQILPNGILNDVASGARTDRGGRLYHSLAGAAAGASVPIPEKTPTIVNIELHTDSQGRLTNARVKDGDGVLNVLVRSASSRNASGG